MQKISVGTTGASSLITTFFVAVRDRVPAYSEPVSTVARAPGLDPSPMYLVAANQTGKHTGSLLRLMVITDEADDAGNGHC